MKYGSAFDRRDNGLSYIVGIQNQIGESSTTALGMP